MIAPWVADNRRYATCDGDHEHDRDCDHEAEDTANTESPIDCYDVLSRSRYPPDSRRKHPYHPSETRANFQVGNDGETFRCWRHDATGNAYHLIGIQAGIIDCGDWLPSGLSSDTWHRIFNAARDAGYETPAFKTGGDGAGDGADEYEAILPALSPREHAIATGWDYTRDDRLRHADGAVDDATDDQLTIEAAQQRTTTTILDALYAVDHRDTLVDALPSMGKSYGTIAAAAEWDGPVTIGTLRGRNEQYEQFATWSRDHGLTPKILPSFFEDCPTANGAHGTEWKRRVRGWYRRGVYGAEIHESAGTFGYNLPCMADDAECPYHAAWTFDPDHYDVLIGSYQHLHNPRATAGRAVIVDEWPGQAYETQLDGDVLAGAVTRFLHETDGLSFDDFGDLLDGRDDERREAALDWFADYGSDRDADLGFAEGGHAKAPLAVYTLLTSESVGDSGFEHASLDPLCDDGVGVYDRESGAIHLLEPPAFGHSRGVIGLDGTPTAILWDLVLGRRFRERPVLDGNAERRRYITEALDHTYIQTTEKIKSYSPSADAIADRVNLGEDMALLAAIRGNHGTRPDLITTRRAKAYYEEAADGFDDLVGRVKYHGDVLGSNAYDESRLGVVIGTQNYGPRYVQLWGAFLGEPVDPKLPGDELELAVGVRTQYNAIGEEIRLHMQDHEVLQAIMRYGRDGHGAVVYVHTSVLPEWVPIADHAHIEPRSAGGTAVIEAIADLADGGREQFTTSDIDDKVEQGERQVRRHLDRLADLGQLRYERAGRSGVWIDDGAGSMNPFGDVGLDGGVDEG